MEILKNFSFSVDKQIFMEQLEIIPDSEDGIVLEILLFNSTAFSLSHLYFQGFISFPICA